MESQELVVIPGETITIDFVLPISKFKVIIKDYNRNIIKEYTHGDFNKENNYYTKDIDTSFMSEWSTYEIQLFSIETDLDEDNVKYVRSWYVSTKDRWDE